MAHVSAWGDRADEGRSDPAVGAAPPAVGRTGGLTNAWADAYTRRVRATGAKPSRNRGNQATRLPKECRFCAGHFSLAADAEVTSLSLPRQLARVDTILSMRQPTP